MIDAANKEQINAVSELVLNTLKNNIPVSLQVVSALRPYKSTLRALTKRKTSVKRRKELLHKQRGGTFWKALDATPSLN